MKYSVLRKIVRARIWADIDENERKLVNVLTGMFILLILDAIAIIFG